MFASLAFSIFEESVVQYHLIDDVFQEFINKYPKGQIEHLLYAKNWVDTVQWHYEDIVRDPNIDPVEALGLKRKIDASNQVRTDMVEFIDGYFLDKYKEIVPRKDARINTESIAWAVDRLSILALKIYHMHIETVRQDASNAHRENCMKKLDILMEQKQDLITAIDQLIEDIENGYKIIKIYKQMKMYNDQDLNPVLYQAK